MGRSEGHGDVKAVSITVIRIQKRGQGCQIMYFLSDISNVDEKLSKLEHGFRRVTRLNNRPSLASMLPVLEMWMSTTLVRGTRGLKQDIGEKDCKKTRKRLELPGFENKSWSCYVTGLFIIIEHVGVGGMKPSYCRRAEPRAVPELLKWPWPLST